MDSVSHKDEDENQVQNDVASDFFKTTSPILENSSQTVRDALRAPALKPDLKISDALQTLRLHILRAGLENTPEDEVLALRGNLRVQHTHMLTEISCTCKVVIFLCHRAKLVFMSFLSLSILITPRSYRIHMFTLYITMASQGRSLSFLSCLSNSLFLFQTLTSLC
jgi:hypothetical protein